MMAGTLGHYRVHEKIGAGGMGEVYRATDARLGRDVALKVLPAAFASDPERLARFEQEARLLAALNHPNIAAIHGLEEAGGVRFLVLELVPGATLAERLRAGPIETREALVIARQVAEALEAAHDRGIIHRDLKPANVKVTPDGRVKVLDFGLAKAFALPEASPGDAGAGSRSAGTGGSPAAGIGESPTATYGATREGIILGTAAYMSPEQARGRPLDRRTDIWSFGCLLFEMLTGRQAFGGDTLSDTIARILERDIDLKMLPAGVPGRVRDLLRRCLQKDAARRLRDIGDARLEVEEALAESTGTAGDPASRRDPGQEATPFPAGRRWPAWVASVTALGLAIAAFAVGRLSMRPTGPGAESLALTSAARLTHDPGISEWPTWSPDGTTLAFASNRGGDFDIYVRRIDGGQEVNVTADPGEDFQPAYSPDGRTIAFISTRSSRTGLIKIGATWGMEFRTLGGDLWVVPALGGPARRLARDANFPAWRPDGRRIAYVAGTEQRRTIEEIDLDTGTTRTVLPRDMSRWEIIRLQYSPGGGWISFGDDLGHTLLIAPAGGDPREIALDGFGHAWLPDGSGICLLTRDPEGGARLRFLPFDEPAGRARGPLRTLGIMTGVLRDLAISRDGRHLAVSEMEGSMRLTLLPLTTDGGAPAGPEEVITGGQVIDRYPAFSPEGRRLAFTSDRLGHMEIWILDLVTRHQERLELPGKDRGSNVAVWATDGRRLALSRFMENGEAVWLAAVDGSDATEIMPPSALQTPADWSPDGRSLLVSLSVDGYLQVFAYDPASRQKRQITTSPRDKFEAQWSPDGRSIAMIAEGDGALQVWRVPAGGGQEEQLTTGHERLRHISWSPDGRWIYVQPSHRNVHRMPAAGGPLRPVTTFPESGLFIEEPVLSPDGRRLAYAKSDGGASLWLLTLGTGEAGD
jgi:Tol biopolymer transport system component